MSKKIYGLSEMKYLRSDDTMNHNFFCGAENIGGNLGNPLMYL